MTEACLACICQASTNCNLTTRCISNGKYCGPFLISRPYWQDAGQLTLVGDRAERGGGKSQAISFSSIAQYWNKWMNWNTLNFPSVTANFTFTVVIKPLTNDGTNIKCNGKGDEMFLYVQFTLLQYTFYRKSHSFISF